MFTSYLITIIPVIFYIFICVYGKSELQLKVAQILCSIYSLAMIIVVVGIITNILTPDSAGTVINPLSIIFLAYLAILILAAVIHPSELANLLNLILYFIALPAAFIFLNIFAMYNMNIISWGTREIQNETKKEEDVKNSKNRVNTWISHLSLEKFTKVQLLNEERIFFEQLIEKHLFPLKQNSNFEQKKIENDLIQLRNSSFLIIVMLNSFFITIHLTVAYLVEKADDSVLYLIPGVDSVINYFTIRQYEPVLLVFIIFFTIILLFQSAAMIWHRLKTFFHLLMKTKITQITFKNNKKKSYPQKSLKNENDIKVVVNGGNSNGFVINNNNVNGKVNENWLNLEEIHSRTFELAHQF
jgi:phosphotransferase system IIB component